MRRAVFILLLLLATSSVLADHPEGEEAHAHAEESEKYFGERDIARDWMFTGYGALVGAFIAWVITHIWYRKK